MVALFAIGKFIIGRPWAAAAIVLAIVALTGGAYLKIRADGYDAGVAATESKYEALMAAQQAANDQAVADAKAFINTLSNRLHDIAREKANETALDRIDAAAADGGCVNERVPPGIVQSINSIE